MHQKISFVSLHFQGANIYIFKYKKALGNNFILRILDTNAHQTSTLVNTHPFCNVLVNYMEDVQRGSGSTSGGEPKGPGTPTVHSAPSVHQHGLTVVFCGQIGNCFPVLTAVGRGHGEVNMRLSVLLLAVTCTFSEVARGQSLASFC